MDILQYLVEIFTIFCLCYVGGRGFIEHSRSFHCVFICTAKISQHLSRTYFIFRCQKTRYKCHIYVVDILRQCIAR